MTAETLIHVWEAAGHGIAPFRVVSVEEKKFVAAPGVPARPGSTCDVCSRAISLVYWIEDATGRRFKTGCDCVRKTGDAGLVRGIKKANEAKDLADRVAARAALRALVADRADELAALPHPKGFRDFKTGQPLSLLDSLAWVAENAGAALVQKAHADALAALAA